MSAMRCGPRAPWMAPCCGGCANRPSLAGAAGDTPSDPGQISTGTAALLALGAIALLVVYGDKLLKGIGG